MAGLGTGMRIMTSGTAEWPEGFRERMEPLMKAALAEVTAKGSGVDKVIEAVEAHQLPAPDFRAGGDEA